MKNRLIIFFIILGSILTIIVFWVNKPLCKNCNVLLISLDTLSAKHLPCYGYDKDTAPNLCQFGKDNILFTNSYAQSTWTRPSQASVFTGLQASTHNVIVTYRDKLNPKYKTIAEILKEHNYKTYYYGPPLDQGSWETTVYNKGFDFNESKDYNRNSLEQWNKALDVLEKNQKEKQPTFIFLHTYYPHDPYLPGDKTDEFKFIDHKSRVENVNIPIKGQEMNVFTEEFNDYVISSLKQRLNSNNTNTSKEIVEKMLNSLKNTKTLKESEKTFSTFSEIEKQSYFFEWYFQILRSVNPNDYVESLYDEKISQLDMELKQIFERINNKFEKDTVIVIYSDHGETLGERGSMSHCDNYPDCLYNEIVRVPLIIKIPGIKSKRVNEISQGIDIYPTILKLLGIETPDQVEGKSLISAIKDGQKIHDYVVSEQGNEQKAIMDKKWKAYFKDYKNITLENVELYDLENDLYEQKNVANENPKIVEEKIDQLKEFVDKNKNIKRSEDVFPDWIDNVKREKLIRGGYF